MSAGAADRAVLVQGGVDLDGTPVSLRLRHGVIAERGPYLAAGAHDVVVDARGGTVMPGLHDHHVHLRSAAAAVDSIHLGPPRVSTDAEARAMLRTAAVRSDGWIRAVGYHESVAGPLDRHRVDLWRADVPVRVQHRSGALWTVNSAGSRLLNEPTDSDGVLFRRDSEFSRRDGGTDGDLTTISTRLASFGVTGCTDATPNMDSGAIDFFENEMRAGRFVQNLHLLARRDRERRAVTFGPVKRILDDTDLVLDDVTTWIEDVHGAGQAVALHCVTVAQLVLTVVALRMVGTVAGDRIEHAAMVPDDVLGDVVDLGVTVVTQPNFVVERGDQYLRDVPESDHGQLWRVASLIGAGVPTAAGTDAPFGDLDPWACMRAARDRAVASGSVLGADERIDARRALDMFLGSAGSPATPRLLQPGHSGDLCILAAPPATVLEELSADLVRATIVRGTVVVER